MRTNVFLWTTALLFSLSLANAQSKVTPSKQPTLAAQPQVQRIAAAREADVPSTWQEPHQQLQQVLVTRAVLERQAELKRDTEKLVALVTELKQSVEKTNTNILSMDVIKKAQEIQKLAKSVQDKMKNPY
jgi:alkanesulfonate monooxygenase SsuD/methylene tetrahydromethanopterin reductase-like flavin-dependent oxidoreductase (luciferase family)